MNRNATLRGVATHKLKTAALPVLCALSSQTFFQRDLHSDPKVCLGLEWFLGVLAAGMPEDLVCLELECIGQWSGDFWMSRFFLFSLVEKTLPLSLTQLGLKARLAISWQGALRT